MITKVTRSPEFIKQIKHLDSFFLKKLNPKTSICIFTNGSLLDDEKIDKIINSKLDIISISVDGGNKKDFETMRVGLLWDVVIRNVNNLVS